MGKIRSGDIIRASRDLFRDRGYDGFSMEDVAARVGIRKASLYGYFSGKDELAEQALKLTLSELAELCTDRGDWLFRYRRLLERVADYLITSRRCLGLHLVYGGKGERTAKATAEFFAELLDVFEVMLQEGLSPNDAKSLAEDSIANLVGATLWLSVNEDSAPMQRMVEILALAAERLADRDDAVTEVLARYDPHERSGSPAEIKLAQAVARLEGLLGLRAMAEKRPV